MTESCFNPSALLISKTPICFFCIFCSSKECQKVKWCLSFNRLWSHYCLRVSELDGKYNLLLGKHAARVYWRVHPSGDVTFRSTSADSRPILSARLCKFRAKHLHQCEHQFCMRTSTTQRRRDSASSRHMLLLHHHQHGTKIYKTTSTSVSLMFSNQITIINQKHSAKLKNKKNHFTSRYHVKATGFLSLYMMGVCFFYINKSLSLLTLQSHLYMLWL